MLEVRKLNTDERGAVEYVFDRAGLTLAGSSVTGGKYYLEVKPAFQVTDSLWMKLQRALNSTDIVINGVVKA